MIKFIIISFFGIILKDASCQDFIFKTLDNHEERITALEANKNNCDCSDIKTKYDKLKLEMELVVNVVNSLKAEMKHQAISTNVQYSTKPSLETTTPVPLAQSTKTAVTKDSRYSSVYSNISTHPSVSESTPAAKFMTTNLPTKTSTTAAVQSDCVGALSNGHKRNGLYNITLHNGKLLEVYCDLERDGGGWTVIQRREDGKQDFNQNWRQYKIGFGDPRHEFWIGNENLHTLTNARNVDLHTRLMTWDGVNHTAVYRGFLVGSEQTYYRLTVRNFQSGDAGDSFTYPSSYMLRHNNMAFSTLDRDNDQSFQHCGQLLQSGWWFNDCYSSNLNGRYLTNGPYGMKMFGESYGQPTMEGTGIEWYPLKHKQYSMKFVEMKIRAR